VAGLDVVRESLDLEIRQFGQVNRERIGTTNDRLENPARWLVCADRNGRRLSMCQGGNKRYRRDRVLRSMRQNTCNNSMLMLEGGLPACPASLRVANLWAFECGPILARDRPGRHTT
jgi:hypothetical protein